MLQVSLNHEKVKKDLHFTKTKMLLMIPNGEQ